MVQDVVDRGHGGESGRLLASVTKARREFGDAAEGGGSGR